MSQSKLRVGIIGVGWYAGMLIHELREMGKVEIGAIARRNPERLALAQEALGVSEAYTDWREMLGKSALDAVVVCTPPNVHAEQTVAALERGQHVFAEKPMTLTSADALWMVEAGAKTDRTLMVGYNTRGMGSWRTIKRVLSEGAIGTLRQVSVNMCIDLRFLWGARKPEDQKPIFESPTYYDDVFAYGNWRTMPDIIGGGMFADVGSHIQDLSLWLANGSPKQVTGFAQSVGSPAIITALAQLDNGVLLSITFNDDVSGGDETGFNSRGSMTFYGDRGQLTAEWSKIMTTEAERIEIQQAGVRSLVEPALETIHPAAAFVATVMDGAPNICPAHEAARTVVLTEAVYRAIEEKRIIEIAPEFAAGMSAVT